MVVHVFVYTTIIHNKQIKGYMTDHTFIIWYVVINKTDKTLIIGGSDFFWKCVKIS